MFVPEHSIDKEGGIIVIWPPQILPKENPENPDDPYNITVRVEIEEKGQIDNLNV